MLGYAFESIFIIDEGNMSTLHCAVSAETIRQPAMAACRNDSSKDQ
ncbi:MAG TPA: hypothetical protein VJU83_03990 [Burkholderiales bacterium]|nr:hypothetical protein [Burkholderiales bacterium]